MVASCNRLVAGRNQFVDSWRNPATAPASTCWLPIATYGLRAATSPLRLSSAFLLVAAHLYLVAAVNAWIAREIERQRCGRNITNLPALTDRFIQTETLRVA
jgi:hypothetical protein